MLVREFTSGRNAMVVRAACLTMCLSATSAARIRAISSERKPATQEGHLVDEWTLGANTPDRPPPKGYTAFLEAGDARGELWLSMQSLLCDQSSTLVPKQTAWVVQRSPEDFITWVKQGGPVVLSDFTEALEKGLEYTPLPLAETSWTILHAKSSGQRVRDAIAEMDVFNPDDVAHADSLAILQGHDASCVASKTKDLPVDRVLKLGFLGGVPPRAWRRTNYWPDDAILKTVFDEAYSYVCPSTLLDEVGLIKRLDALTVVSDAVQHCWEHADLAAGGEGNVTSVITLKAPLGLSKIARGKLVHSNPMNECIEQVAIDLKKKQWEVMRERAIKLKVIQCMSARSRDGFKVDAAWSGREDPS